MIVPYGDTSANGIPSVQSLGLTHRGAPFRMTSECRAGLPVGISSGTASCRSL